MAAWGPRGESRLALVAAAGAGAATVGALGILLAWRSSRRHGKRRPQDECEVKLEAACGPPACRAEWLRAPPGARPRVALVATGSVASVKVPELAASLCTFAEVVVILTRPGHIMATRVASRYAPARVFEWELLQGDGQLHVLGDEDEWEGYENVAEDPVLHIELRRWADVAVVAPCSANTLAKVALGICDNLATCFLRAWDPEKPVVFAPAMNTVMWEHPSTAQHLRTLESWGYRILPPASKRLACGDVGRGALPPVAEVLAAARRAAEGFEGRKGQNGSGAWQRRGFPEWEAIL